MSDEQDPPESKADRQPAPSRSGRRAMPATRFERQAQALRDNLRRRKAQGRQRAARHDDDPAT